MSHLSLQCFDSLLRTVVQRITNWDLSNTQWPRLHFLPFQRLRRAHSSVLNKDLTMKAKAKDLSLDHKDKFKDCSLLLQLQWRRQDLMLGAQKLRKNNLRVAHKTIIIFM